MVKNYVVVIRSLNAQLSSGTQCLLVLGENHHLVFMYVNRLHECAGSLKPLLVDNMTGAIYTRTGSYAHH